MFALAAEGEAGVRNTLQMLRDEFEPTMALSGCTSLRGISRSRMVTEADTTNQSHGLKVVLLLLLR